MSQVKPRNQFIIIVGVTMKFFVFCSSLLVFAQAAKLPSTFPKCSLKDPNMGACLKSSLQKILPQLTRSFKEAGLPSVDPLQVPSVHIGAGSGPVNVEQKYRDVQILGFSRIIMEKAEFNFEKKTLYLEGTTPQLQWLSQYEIDGKILVLPVRGQGRSTLTIEKPKCSVALTFEIVEKNGKKFLHFLTSTGRIYPEKVSYLFENLFDGDKALGDNINKVINENWKDVFDDVKEGYEKAISQIALGLINGLFGKIPMTEAFAP